MKGRKRGRDPVRLPIRLTLHEFVRARDFFGTASARRTSTTSPNIHLANMAAVSNNFVAALQKSPHEFLQPSLPLYTDAIAYLKNFLDPLAQDVSTEQQQRLNESRKKRKRGQIDGDEEVLRLKQLHTDGFGVEQVWEQARRVIDAAREEAEREIELAQAEESDESDAEPSGKKAVKFADELDEDDEDADSEDMGVEGVDYEVEGVDDGEGEFSDEEEEEEGLDGEEEDEDDDALEAALDGEDMDMHDDFDDMDEDTLVEEEAPELVNDKFGLNDGFFSIDDFNKQSEFLEQQDARGDDDGAASDEEDVDWDADPLGKGAGLAITDGGEAAAGAEDSEDEDGGPTFGDPDALSEDEDEDIDGGELDGMGGMGNTNDVMYKDFFAPPAQKKKKNKKGRPHPHNFPAKAADPQEEEQDMTRTMEAVHRDLFEDDASEEEEEEEDEEQQAAVNRADPRSRRSAHERRKAELAEEIRKLEAANVAKREWTLSGEARAADRPMNSLLEQDLDFERAGKPVPVITAEVSESIEELIKRRILAMDFQDIPRRRPDDLATGKDGRRGAQNFELDDTKSKKGLADEYEEEHLKRTDPNFVDVKDEKLAKEQKEIEALWREVSGQLDSLSSWHFRPKQAAPQLDIRVDTAAIVMEDARPNAGGDVAGASQLAPQEVYKAGEATEKGSNTEVVGKSGLPAGREELTKDERKRRRRREKERIRKAGGTDDKNESRAKKDKKAMLGDLKRGGVKVIGKKGEVQDVDGNASKQEGGGQGAAKYML